MILQLHRQFALAQYLYSNISDEDKDRLLFDPDTGKWSGYKHPYGFKVRIPSLIPYTKTYHSHSATEDLLMALSNLIGILVNGKTWTEFPNVYTPSWTRSRPSAIISPSL